MEGIQWQRQGEVNRPVEGKQGSDSRYARKGMWIEKEMQSRRGERGHSCRQKGGEEGLARVHSY
jgi:hypothetical protein